MLQRFLQLFLLAGLLFLTACGGTLSIGLDTTATPNHDPVATVKALETRIATLQVAKHALDMTTDSETIRRALLNSHNQWQTVWFDGPIATESEGGGHQAQRVQAWVDRKTARFRVLTGLSEGMPDTMQVSDGVSQARINLKDMTTQTQTLGSDAHNLDWQAPQTAALPAEGKTISAHPLDLEIDSPVAELLFPAVLAERGGTFTPTGMEQVAGRMTLMVEYWESSVILDRLWVDTETAVVLRRDSYSKTDVLGRPVSSIAASKVLFDQPFPESLFSLKLSDKPQFSLDASGDTGYFTPAPTTQLPPGAGDLYFVIDRSPEALDLASLPADCVASSAPCPGAKIVAGFPNKDNTILPLFWSPDGSQAALIQQGSLYRYTPADGGWKELGKFPILREEVVWSPDGKTLVFVVQLEDGKQDIFTLQADGKNLQNLTSQKFTDENTTLWVDGFLADGRLLFEVVRKNATQIYTMRPGDPPEAIVPDFSLAHGILSISQDRKQIAYSTEQDGGVNLQVTGVNLGEATKGSLRSGDPRPLVSFRQSAMQQILWTAEENGTPWVVFLVSSGSSDENVVNTVFAVRPDGSDLRQLFQDRGIQRLVAPPGGKFVIAEGTANGRLIIIPIDEGDTRFVEAPGLRLDQRLLGASWR